MYSVAFMRILWTSRVNIRFLGSQSTAVQTRIPFLGRIPFEAFQEEEYMK